MMDRRILAALSAFTLCLAAPAHAQIQWTLTGDEAPTAKPWTQPASFSWVDSTEDSEDRFTIDAALKASGAFNEDTGWFVRGVAHVSDQAKKEQETVSAQFGLTHDAFIGGSLDANGARIGALSLYSDLYLSWNSKARFATPDDPACVTDPTNPVCGTQHQRSARAALDLQPFLLAWEQAYGVETTVDGRKVADGTWAYSFAPQLILFHDEVTEATVNAAGLEEDGGVGGAKLLVSFAFSPPIWGHRLAFRTSLQHLQTFYRSDARAAVFERSTSVVKASVDYEFGRRSWEGVPGWSPSVALAYSSGEDPLDGRRDKDDISIALRLTYTTP
jgi:hypothetical protein